MSREIRRVPATWKHPKDSRGNYIGLLNGIYQEHLNDWNEGYEMWQKGLCEQWGKDEKWAPVDEIFKSISYSEYSGDMPSPDDYMPQWSEEEKTHIMMYETTSEGTPISPAFETPEELAQWLFVNEASAFGDQTATYEEWLNTCKRGWAPSAIGSSQGLVSGVEALAHMDKSK